MQFILRRLGFYLVAFWASVTLNFLLSRLMPGDPISRMMSQSQGRMTPEQVEQLQALFGLDNRPMWQQYLDYWKSIFTGDMGVSISRFPTPVSEVISSQIGWTILLGGTALLFAVVIGNLLGILAAWRRGGILDSVGPPTLVFLGSFPYFWLAMGALCLFGIVLGWFPLATPSKRRNGSGIHARVHRRVALAPGPARGDDHHGVHRWVDARQCETQ